MVKVIVKTDDLNNIEQYGKLGVSEILLSCRELSQVGNMDISELGKYVDLCNNFKIVPVLNWDRLETDLLLDDQIELFKKLIKNHSSIILVRVLDLGVAQYLKENHSQIKIQLNLKNLGNNLISAKSWISYFKSCLDRIILPVESSYKDHLKILKEVNVACELYVLGPIQMFYSPRKLLSSSLDGVLLDNIEYITSEESAHKDLPIVETNAGTIIYNNKHLSLIEYIKEFMQDGINYFMVDLSMTQNKQLILKKLFEHIDNDCFFDTAELQSLYNHRLIKGFHDVNKTDVLFDKLKNIRLLRYDRNFIGEVVDIIKGHRIGIEVKSGHNILENDMPLCFITPEGKKINFRIKEIFNSTNRKVNSAKLGEIVFFKHIKGVCAKSIVVKIE